jgi:hypothetical protein
MRNIIEEHKIKKIIEEDRLSLKSDNIYYNVSVTNDDPTMVASASFSDNRIVPILKKRDDYYCAIVRFRVPITSVPLLIFESDDYHIQLSYHGVNYNSYVGFISHGNDTLYSPPINAIRDVQHFLDCINTTLNNLYDAVAAANPLDPNIPLNDPPIIIFDRATQLFSLRCRTEFVNTVPTGSPTPPFNPPLPNVLAIYFNFPLNDLFLFESIVSTNPVSQAQPLVASMIIVKDNGNNLVTIGGHNYYNMTQDQSTVYLLAQFESIVFVSNSLGTKAEDVPGIGGGDNTLSIIADFELAQTTPLDRGYAQFFQTGPYRWIDFDATDQLRNLKIDAYWSSVDGRLFPLYLFTNQIMTMKLLFRKKSVANSGK